MLTPEQRQLCSPLGLQNERLVEFTIEFCHAHVGDKAVASTELPRLHLLDMSLGERVKTSTPVASPLGVTA